jgi:2-keto-4-pentenoate hydratase/2-oxohepta-3-ene-1,7-dioic acid hydratase in catechol pathway
VRHEWTADNGNTSFMTFTIPQVIAYLSEWVTFLPGDIIALGVPEPTAFFKEGQTAEMVIEGLGRLRNRVVSRPMPGYTTFPPRRVPGPIANR